jgi:folate-binding protein YgfZ
MTAQVRSLSRAFFDLSPRVKLRVSGRDRLRYLNGQLTNDVRKATETKAVEACVLNAKGKMDAHLFLHTDGDAFLLDADPTLQSTLQPRLERYVIADDVTIEDATAQMSIFHVIAESVPKVSVAARVISTDRFGRNGHDLWIDASKRDEVAAELAGALAFCDENCAEVFRIEQGIPRWGRELTNEIIPVEANLEARCIDYEKGCYIGQETISRMKMSGQRNKQLCGLISTNGEAFAPESRIVAEAGGKEIGWITSATRSGDREIGLGYVKRGFNSVGSKIQAPGAQNSTVPAEIVGLPFMLR